MAIEGIQGGTLVIIIVALFILPIFLTARFSKKSFGEVLWILIMYSIMQIVAAVIVGAIVGISLSSITSLGGAQSILGVK